MKNLSNTASTYYRRYADLNSEEEQLVQSTIRIPQSQSDFIDSAAKHFGVSRSQFIADVLQDAIPAFTLAFIEECYHADDRESLDRFFQATGNHAASAEHSFQVLRDDGLKGSAK